VPEENRLAEAIVWGLRERARAGNRTAAIVEPVSGDVPDRGHRPWTFVATIDNNWRTVAMLGGQRDQPPACCDVRGSQRAQIQLQAGPAIWQTAEVPNPRRLSWHGRVAAIARRSRSATWAMSRPIKDQAGKTATVVNAPVLGLVEISEAKLARSDGSRFA